MKLAKEKMNLKTEFQQWQVLISNKTCEWFFLLIIVFFFFKIKMKISIRIVMHESSKIVIIIIY